MASFRDIKSKGRADLHQRMKVPALYLFASDPALAVDVRVHTKFGAVGGLRARDDNSAEIQNTTPRILFERAVMEKPRRNAVVSVAEGEAYRIDNVLPPDGDFVTAEVTSLTAAEAVGLPLP